MKWILLWMVCCWFAESATARQVPPAFGKVSSSAFEISEGPSDHGAGAVKLLDIENMSFTLNVNDPSSLTTVVQRRTRIKILNEAGMSYANVSIPWYHLNNDEKITSVKAFTYNLAPGGHIKRTTISRSSMYTRTKGKQMSELVIVFPEVVAGSIIEYQYTIQAKPGGDMDSWYFQGNIPVRYSEYTVKIPSQFSFSIQPFRSDSLEMTEAEYKDFEILRGIPLSNTGIQKTFIMRNLPAIRREPLMGALKDYVQRLSIRLMAVDFGNGKIVRMSNSWDELAKELMKDPDFGGQIRRTVPGANELIAQVSKIEQPESRMRALYEHITTNFHSSGNSGIYPSASVRAAFESKSGSSADINLVLIALLRHCGLHALPVLFSTRDNGTIDTLMPSLHPFNKLMAWVEINDQHYILDATEKYGSYKLFPYDVLNTTGLVIDIKTSHWFRADYPGTIYKIVTTVQGNLDTSGMMQGDVVKSATGYAALQQPDHSGNPDSESEIGEAGIENLLSTKAGASTAGDSLLQETRFHYSLKLNSTSELLYFKTSLFTGFSSNPFSASERQSDIDFGYPREYVLFGSYTIPGNFSFEELPGNVSLIMPDTGIIFRRFLVIDNNTLNMRLTIDFKKPTYPAAQYPEFAAFYKILLVKLNEQVIIKKKDQQ